MAPVLGCPLMNQLQTDLSDRGSASPGERRLLFVGVDWKRKGGDFALRIAKRLNDRGIRAELTIVGGTPEIPEEMKDLVNVVGFVAKRLYLADVINQNLEHSHHSELEIAVHQHSGRTEACSLAEPTQPRN